jgi:hypothetical protein
VASSHLESSLSDQTSTHRGTRPMRTSADWDRILADMSSGDEEETLQDAASFDGKSVPLLKALRNADGVVESMARKIDPALVPEDLKAAHAKAVAAPPPPPPSYKNRRDDGTTTSP